MFQRVVAIFSVIALALCLLIAIGTSITAQNDYYISAWHMFPDIQDPDHNYTSDRTWANIGGGNVAFTIYRIPLGSEMQSVADKGWWQLNHGFAEKTFIPQRSWKWEVHKQPSLKSYSLRMNFPFWLPMALLSVLPIIQIARHRLAKRRSLHNCCKNCGYDLRATPDRCPECGTVRAVEA